jgi:hypothetical protein
MGGFLSVLIYEYRANYDFRFSAMMAAADEAAAPGDASGPKVQKQQKAGAAGKKARR